MLRLKSSRYLVRQEVRAVERRVLLETLASRLPPNTISFSSRLKSIERQGSEGTLLELDDGSHLLAKVDHWTLNLLDFWELES